MEFDNQVLDGDWLCYGNLFEDGGLVGNHDEREERLLIANIQSLLLSSMALGASDNCKAVSNYLGIPGESRDLRELI